MKYRNNILSLAKPQSRRDRLPGGITLFSLCFAAIFIISTIILPPLQAQNIDMEEMRQDINILESVLEEMFETSWEAYGNNVYVVSGTVDIFGFGNSDEINDTYIPGYGVIFTIPGGPPAFVAYSDADKESAVFSFQNGDEVNQQTITNKIIEFLRNYGSTINQLSANDKMMVLYNATSNDRGISFHQLSGDEVVEKQFLPAISVIANYRDLQAAASGNLSDDEFRNRLKIDTSFQPDKNRTDLKIMANILETAFDDGEDKQFQISGDVNYLKIDNFGALFSFEISYGGPFDAISILGDKLRASIPIPPIPPVEINIDSLPTVSIVSNGEEIVSIDSMDVEKLKAHIVKIKNNFEEKLRERRKKIEEKQAERRANMQEALDQFLSTLKIYITDYGGTLDSISPNQHILVSVEVNSGFDELPERVVLQVEKSVLEAAERGDMSENEAMDRITVRKY